MVLCIHCSPEEESASAREGMDMLVKQKKQAKDEQYFPSPIVLEIQYKGLRHPTLKSGSKAYVFQPQHPDGGHVVFLPQDPDHKCAHHFWIVVHFRHT